MEMEEKTLPLQPIMITRERSTAAILDDRTV